MHIGNFVQILTVSKEAKFVAALLAISAVVARLSQSETASENASETASETASKEAKFVAALLTISGVVARLSHLTKYGRLSVGLGRLAMYGHTGPWSGPSL